MMRWLLACITLISLLLVAGCGRKASAPVEVTRVVEVTREVLVVATATSLSLPTVEIKQPAPAVATQAVVTVNDVVLLPTPTPLPLPVLATPVIPTGWLPYELLVGGVAFYYPPTWTKTNEELGSVTFEQGSMSIIVSRRDDLSFTDMVGSGGINTLKTFIVSNAPDGYDVSFYREGTLDAPHNPAYVTALWTVDGISISTLSSYATDGDQTLLVMLINAAPSISDTDIDTVGQLVRSALFSWDAEISLVLPTAAVTSEPTPTAITGPHVEQSANLRGGPGTAYPIVGGLVPGDTLEILARNDAGDWYLIRTASGQEAWAASFLVTGAPEVATLEIVTVEPLAAAPESAPVELASVEPSPIEAVSAEPVVASSGRDSSGFPQIGDEVEGSGWRFKVVEVHKRKSLYFYDNSVVAFGHFLVIIIDNFNAQSGTDYFARNLLPWVTDDAANEYLDSSKGSSYAKWQYGGLGSMYSDLNPGQWGRIALVYDLPDDLGDIYLSVATPAWVYLGNFSAMPVEP